MRCIPKRSLHDLQHANLPAPRTAAAWPAETHAEGRPGWASTSTHSPARCQHLRSSSSGSPAGPLTGTCCDTGCQGTDSPSHPRPGGFICRQAGISSGEMKEEGCTEPSAVRAYITCQHRLAAARLLESHIKPTACNVQGIWKRKSTQHKRY